MKLVTSTPQEIPRDYLKLLIASKKEDQSLNAAQKKAFYGLKTILTTKELKRSIDFWKVKQLEYFS